MAAKPQESQGVYDHAKRRRAQRHGRQKGCSIYIPAVELEGAGFADADEIFYRVWGTSKDGGIQVRLYREQ